MRESREVDALELQAGVAGGADDAVDHLAADRDDDHALALLALRVDDPPERLEVEDRLVHRHRDVIRRLDADGRGERLRVVDRRKVERAHDDALVGDAQAHAARQVVLGEQRLERLGEGLRVGDLAVADDARAQMRDRAAGDGDRAVDAHLGGGDVARVELEPDDGGLLGGTVSLEHGSDIGTRAGALEGSVNDEAGPEARFAKYCCGAAVDYQLVLFGPMRVTLPVASRSISYTCAPEPFDVTLIL